MKKLLAHIYRNCVHPLYVNYDGKIYTRLSKESWRTENMMGTFLYFNVESNKFLLKREDGLVKEDETFSQYIASHISLFDPFKNGKWFAVNDELRCFKEYLFMCLDHFGIKYTYTFKDESLHIPSKPSSSPFHIGMDRGIKYGRLIINDRANAAQFQLYFASYLADERYKNGM